MESINDEHKENKKFSSPEDTSDEDWEKVNGSANHDNKQIVSSQTSFGETKKIISDCNKRNEQLTPWQSVKKMMGFAYQNSENIPLITVTNRDVEKDEANEAIHALKESSAKDSAKGLLLSFLGAGVMYGVTSVLVRLAAQNGVGAMQLLAVRSLFQATLFGTLLKCNSIPLLPPSDRYKRCIAIAFIYATATMTSYEAFNLIPPGSAIATRGAARNIFAIILSFFIAKERIKAPDFVVIVLCIAGIAMIISSGIISGNPDYVLSPGMSTDPQVILAVGFVLITVAGITRSLGMIFVRIVKAEVHTFAVIFYHSSVTLAITSILAIILHQPNQWPPSPAGIGYTVGVCVTSAIATFSSNRSVVYVHPALASLGQNADIFVSIAFQHIILKMAPMILEIAGAMLIALGICGLTLYKYRQRQNIMHQEFKNEDSSEE